MLAEFDQLGHMPIVELALQQLAGYGAQVSIITQSIPAPLLTERLDSLERQVSDRMVVDFVRHRKAKSGTRVEPESKLASEIVPQEETLLEEEETAAVETEGPVSAAQPESIAEPDVDLAALRPPTTIFVSKMNKLTKKTSGRCIIVENSNLSSLTVLESRSMSQELPKFRFSWSKRVKDRPQKKRLLLAGPISASGG